MAYLYVPVITAKDGEIHPAKDDGGDLVTGAVYFMRQGGSM